MQRALQRHDAKSAHVIPILLRSVDLNHAPFEKLEALPSDGKPVTAWSDQDAALTDIAQGIRFVLEGRQPGKGKKEAETTRTVGSISDERQREIPVIMLKKSEEPSQMSFGAPFPEIWNIPRRHTSFFTGRDQVLEQIADGFRLKNEAGMVPYQALTGLGGIGKTQTSAEYAYRSRRNYDAVFWIGAETQEDLVAGFRAIADQLQLPEKGLLDQITMVKAVQKWLRTSTRWLLILDNADDLPLVAAFLPEAAAGHLLLTTRMSATVQLAQPLALNLLESEDGATFILRRAGYLKWNEQLDRASIASVKAARELSRLMNGLPLALEQAGAYIEDTGCGVQRYLDLYQNFRARLQRLHSGAIPDYPEPIACAWKVSWGMVEQRSPAAADLLRLCAFLSPETIPEEILIKGASVLGSYLGIVATNPVDLDSVIGLLRRSSSLHREVDRETDLPRLSIHRIIQQVLQDEMDPPTQQLWAERAVRAVAQAIPTVEWQVMQTHVRRCAQLIKQWNMTFREANHLLRSLKEKE